MKSFQRRELIRLIKETDLSGREIARQVGISHTTVANYRRKLAKSPLDWNTLSSYSDDKIKEIFCFGQRKQSLKRLPDWSLVDKQMSQKHQTLVQLWEEYRLIDPVDAYSYSQYCDSYLNYRKKLDLSMRQVHRAGQNAFVDYAGSGVPWRDLDSNTDEVAQIFVGALGCSDLIYAHATRGQTTADWIEGQEEMLHYFGGVPECLVPDNPKALVTLPGKALRLNRAYQEFAQHYKCLIAPARVRKPKDKSKAELSVLIVSRWILAPLRRQQFFSLDEINKAIRERLEILNNRPFKRIAGSRRSRFEELDKPVLKPLPAQRFTYGDWIAYGQKLSLNPTA